MAVPGGVKIILLVVGLFLLTTETHVGAYVLRPLPNLVVTSCAALRDGRHVTGPRQEVRWPDGTKVLCDTETDGGGWTVFQRRQDGTVRFYRSWIDYENGFGDTTSEFWLGLRRLNSLMCEGPQELRIDLKYRGVSYYAHYSLFYVGDSKSKYKLRIKGFSGNVGDRLSYHDNYAFSTADNDNDGNVANCAHIYGAWWYTDKFCHACNLNGLWGADGWKGLSWNGLTDPAHDSVEFVEMKTRPVFY